MPRRAPVIHSARSTPPNIFPRQREVLPSPAVLVVSRDGLLRWALYEALTAVRLRVLACCDEAHAREILPRVDTDFALAIVDDDAWPMTRTNREWLQRRWPDLPIVVLAHSGQGVEHRTQNLGLTHVVLKPFDVHDLVQLADRIIAAPVRTRRAREAWRIKVHEV